MSTSLSHVNGRSGWKIKLNQIMPVAIITTLLAIAAAALAFLAQSS